MCRVWFNQFEAYLTIKGIADRSLWFLYASFSLSPDEKRKVTGSAGDKLLADAYFQLKKSLLHLYESDRTSRIHKLFTPSSLPLVSLCPSAGKRTRPAGQRC